MYYISLSSVNRSQFKVQNKDSIGVGKGPDPRVPMKEFIDRDLSVV